MTVCLSIRMSFLLYALVEGDKSGQNDAPLHNRAPKYCLLHNVCVIALFKRRVATTITLFVHNYYETLSLKNVTKVKRSSYRPVSQMIGTGIGYELSFLYILF